MDTNPNQLWTSIFVDQLSKLGVKHVVIGAGSRSTPLTLAFTRHPKFSCYSQVDERSAAFFGLGIAKSTDTPVVLVCTSGTAAANFYPAIIEAQSSSIPLIVCTADRPAELRISGANQTTDQIKLYGDHVNWFTDVALPETNLTSRMQGYLQSLAMQAVEKSQYPNQGPVHLNFPFRKPLEPNSDQNQQVDPIEITSELNLRANSISFGHSAPSDDLISEFNNLITSANRLMVICGPNAERDVSPNVFKKFIDQTGAIALVDALSGYRYISERPDIITAYESFLKFMELLNLPTPDVIVQIGDMPISKYLSHWMNKIDTNWVILNHRVSNTDGLLRSNTWFKVHPEKLLSTFMGAPEIEEQYIQRWQNFDHTTKELSNSFLSKHEYFEPSVIDLVLSQLPNSTLFVANSLGVRHFDQFIHSSTSDFEIYTNRGVSGIDGTLSTALGIAVTEQNPVVLVTGDLAFYHDVNGLLAMMRYKIPLKILIINNAGGAIFDRLPINRYEPPFEEYFLTRHQLNFDRIAEQYNIQHLMVSDSETLHNALVEFVKLDQVILEVNFESNEIEQLRQKFLQQIKDNVSSQ